MVSTPRLGRVTAVLAAVLSSLCLVASPPGSAATTPLVLKVSGRHFVDGAGHTVRLVGVNHTSAEYGCVDGFGYDDGHFDAADAAAIRAWGATAVRIPLNEDCWLGINGQPNSSEGADPALTVAGYRHEIEQYVADLHAQGLYAILDLHWSAPGAQVAFEQQPMPDADHAPAFWTSVATTFKADHAVAFDLYNEPFDPTDSRSGSDPNRSDRVTWNCWGFGTIGGRSGGTPCTTQAYDDSGNPTTRYRIAGMQALVDAVRATGATQPVLLGGLDYANDLGDSNGGASWLSHLPADSRQQEAASFHNYMGKACDNAACWKSAIGGVAAKVPVVTGEFAEDDFDEATCANHTPSTFDERYLDWADGAGVSYLAWGWIVESPAELSADGCGAYVLISDYAHYTPSAPNGVAVHDHLHALAVPPALTRFAAVVRAGVGSLGVTARASEAVAVAVSAKSVHRYAVGGQPLRRVPLGSVHLSLAANATRTVTLTLTADGKTLLKKRGSLETEFTITLTNTAGRVTTVHRTVTLRVP